MSGNSFNDFAALKALKRELERADAAASGEESSAKSAEAASCAESAGTDSGTMHSKSKPAEPKPSPKAGAQAPALRPGMRVTLIDSNDRGVVRHVRKECVEIELECGIVVPVGMRDFIVNDAEEDRNLSIGAAALLDYGLSAFGLREKGYDIRQECVWETVFLNAPEIHFNISHSGLKVAVALSDREVGCDIEQIADIEMEVEERFFCRDEYEEMMSETDFEARRKAFSRFWTLKESYMKAAGLGMSLPPASFSVKGGIPEVCEQ